jgi:hypothetical protein
MKKETLSATLLRLDACQEARKWAKGKSLKTAWAKCERGDWMIWLLTHPATIQDDRLLRLLACDIAETVLHFVPAGEDRPRLAIEAARVLANTPVNTPALSAADAAWSAALSAADAAWSAALSAAWSAARSAADAARSAAWSAALSAAWSAARSAADAARSAADAAWSAASRAANSQHADLVRKWYPVFPGFKEKP